MRSKSRKRPAKICRAIAAASHWSSRCGGTAVANEISRALPEADSQAPIGPERRPCAGRSVRRITRAAEQWYPWRGFCRLWGEKGSREAGMRLIGVDVGGTFTDLVYADTEAGRTGIHKI